MYVWNVKAHYDSTDGSKVFSAGLFSDREKALSAVRFFTNKYSDKEVTEIGEFTTMIKVWNHDEPTKWETYFIEKEEVF